MYFTHLLYSGVEIFNHISIKYNFNNNTNTNSLLKYLHTAHRFDISILPKPTLFYHEQ